MSNTTLQKVTAALAPTEEILRAEYERQLVVQFDKFVQTLTADGMDANVHYFYPSQRKMSNFYDKKAYRQQLAQHQYAMSHSSSVGSTSSFDGPDLRTVDREAILPKLAAKAAKMAKEALEGFCYKLAGKIDRAGTGITDITYHGGKNPWDYSHVIVEAESGRQTWRTQMIINVSCLGKLFNQWPTRLVK